jgi:hypothetical protein
MALTVEKRINEVLRFGFASLLKQQVRVQIVTAPELLFRRELQTQLPLE